MKVKGIKLESITWIAKNLDIELSNIRKAGRFIAFKASPVSSYAKYARRTGSGRRIKALCYHGRRDFIQELFNGGATAVETAHGRWYSKSAFERDLYRLANINVGSIMYPALMITLCDCPD